MLITKLSPVTGILNTLDIPMTQNQYDQYVNGESHVQVIFPELSAAQREFLISGCTEADWNSIFAEEN